MTKAKQPHQSSTYCLFSFKFFKPVDSFTRVDRISLPVDYHRALTQRNKAMLNFLEYDRHALDYQDFSLEDWFIERDISILKYADYLSLHNPSTNSRLFGLAYYEIIKVFVLPSMEISIIDMEKIQSIATSLPMWSIEKVQDKLRKALSRPKEQETIF